MDWETRDKENSFCLIHVLASTLDRVGMGQCLGGVS